MPNTPSAKPNPENTYLPMDTCPWWICDDALISPLELVSFILIVVFGFGMIAGNGAYAFVATLFTPAFAAIAAMIILQIVARRISGQPNYWQSMRKRLI